MRQGGADGDPMAAGAAAMPGTKRQKAPGGRGGAAPGRHRTRRSNGLQPQGRAMRQLPAIRLPAAGGLPIAHENASSGIACNCAADSVGAL